MQELEDALVSYKNKTYEFGKYSTEEDIKWAYFNNKTFVFKAGFNALDYFLIIPFWSLAILFLILSFIIFIGMFAAVIVFILIGAIPFIKIGGFLVIGRQGVYFKKTGKPKYFSLQDVINIREREKLVEGVRFYYSICYLNNGKKHIFNTRLYKRKEFPRKGSHKLFMFLIRTYWESVQNAENEGRI